MRSVRQKPLWFPPRGAEALFILYDLYDSRSRWLKLPWKSGQTGEVVVQGILSHSGVHPARLQINGRLSSIYPILQDEHLIRTNFEFGTASVQYVPEGGSIKFAYSSETTAAVRFEIVANRIGSKLDPVLRILDEAGRELFFSDDTPFALRDCRLEFRPKKKKRYQVEVRDVANAGGPEYFFVIRAHNERNPPAAHPEAAESLAWIRDASEVSRQKYGQQVDIEKTNDKQTDAQEIDLGARLIGSFDRPKDTDWYRFKAAKDQTVVISIATREIGVPCDAKLGLFGSNRALIKESIGEGMFGPSITNVFKEPGEFFARVSEVSNFGGGEFEYGLEIRGGIRGVVLNTDVERIEFKDGQAKLKLSCQRFDYDGPILFKLDGLPEGIEATGTIPEKKSEGELTFKATTKPEPFQVRVKGVTNDGQEFHVSTMPALRKLYPLMMFPSAAMDGWIAVNPQP